MRAGSTRRTAAPAARRPGVKLAAAVLTILAAVLLAACGSSSSSSTSSSAPAASSTAAATGAGKSLTLGTKDFTEEFVIGQLYRQALEAKGYTVNYKQSIGATEIVDKALTSGQIDAYPEYTGESVAQAVQNTKETESAPDRYRVEEAFSAK